MEIDVLGSGSSGNCTVVSDGKTRVLLDCGLPFKAIQQALHFDLGSVAGCYVTHHHQDHCKAVQELILRGVRCAAPAPAAALIDSGMSTILKDSGSQMYLPDSCGTLRIVPFPVPHLNSDESDCPCFGYLLHSTETSENLVYITDAFYCRYNFHRLHYLLIECNYMDERLFENTARSLSKRVLKSHMSLSTCLDFLRANDLSEVKKIYLMHLSDNRSDAPEMKRQVQELTGKDITIC